MAGSDFLTNMVRPLVVSYNLLKPDLDEVYTVDVDINVLNNLLTISAFTLRYIAPAPIHGNKKGLRYDL